MLSFLISSTRVVLKMETILTILKPIETKISCLATKAGVVILFMPFLHPKQGSLP
jgi:hypothetical protein